MSNLIPAGVDPATIPLASPPPGVIPNYVDPYNRTWQIWVTCAVCLTVTTFFVALRLFAKVFVIKQTAWDDYATAIAYAGVIIYISLTIAFEDRAYGIHIWNLTLASLNDHQQLILLVNNCLYGPVLFAVKLSIFLMINSIFGTLKWLRHLVLLGIVVTGLFYLANVIVFASLCAPRPGQGYLEASTMPLCSKRTVTFSLFSASFNIVTDFYILLLPIPAVMGLQMPTKRKVGVLAIFATGLTACITSCFALWTRVQLDHTKDRTWKVTPTDITAIIEMNVGMWCGSMPALAGLIRKQNFGIGLMFSKLRSRISSVSALLSTRQSRQEKSDALSQSTPSNASVQNSIPKKPQEQYLELQDQDDEHYAKHW